MNHSSTLYTAVHYDSDKYPCVIRQVHIVFNVTQDFHVSAWIATVPCEVLYHNVVSRLTYSMDWYTFIVIPVLSHNVPMSYITSVVQTPRLQQNWLGNINVGQWCALILSRCSVAGIKYYIKGSTVHISLLTSACDDICVAIVLNVWQCLHYRMPQSTSGNSDIPFRWLPSVPLS